MPTSPKKPRFSPPDAKRVQEVFRRLSAEYPDFRTELTYRNPYELTIAVILSAQCTDARVNQTTPGLFAKYPTPERLAAANPADVEKLIHSCGFFRAKTKSIMGAAKAIAEEHGGQVPGTLDKLVKLPGVGRKTASVVLNQAFDEPAIAVDTHVKRVALRLGWTANTDPVKVEFDLRALLPPKQWGQVNGMLILHGRRLCPARKPRCEECPVRELCAFYASIKGSTKPSGRAKASKRPA
jgi:endonuclease-3